MSFIFKKLRVWQKAMDFAEKCCDITESLSGHYRLVEQLESCSASVPQNISEGEGRNSIKENVHFLYIAKGSLYEAITLLNLFQRKNFISLTQLDDLESLAIEITKMINTLISKKLKSL